MRGLDTDIGHRLSQILEDYPYCLLDAQVLGDVKSADEWFTFFEEEELSVCLNLCSPTSTAEADAGLGAFTVLAEACRAKGIPLIQISSYRVYGESYLNVSPEEKDFPDPEDDFGKGLVLLEQAAARVEKHITLRLSWLLDGKCSLFEGTVKDVIECKPLIASDHKFGRPVSVSFVSLTIVALIQQVLSGAENWGIFHLHSSDLCSEAEFCDHLNRFLSTELDKDLDMPEIATKGDERCIFVGSANIQGRRITNDFGVQLPSWRSGFRRLLKTWIDQKQLGINEKS